MVLPQWRGGLVHTQAYSRHHALVNVSVVSHRPWLRSSPLSAWFLLFLILLTFTLSSSQNVAAIIGSFLSVLGLGTRHSCRTIDYRRLGWHSHLWYGYGHRTWRSNNRHRPQFLDESHCIRRSWLWVPFLLSSRMILFYIVCWLGLPFQTIVSEAYMLGEIQVENLKWVMNVRFNNDRRKSLFCLTSHLNIDLARESIRDENLGVHAITLGNLIIGSVQRILWPNYIPSAPKRCRKLRSIQYLVQSFLESRNDVLLWSICMYFLPPLVWLHRWDTNKIRVMRKVAYGATWRPLGMQPPWSQLSAERYTMFSKKQEWHPVIGFWNSDRGGVVWLSR